MTFDFPDELKQLRDEARKFLTRFGVKPLVRQALDGAPYDPRLWQAMAQLGWMGAAIPEEYGGAGMGPLAVCVLAEEVGHAVAPVPFASSVYLATEALMAFGSPAQQAHWLPLLACGEAVGTLALVEREGPIARSRIAACVQGARLYGAKMPVADAALATFAIVVAADEQGHMLHLVEMPCPGVACSVVTSLDSSRPQARLEFDQAPCAALPGARNWSHVRHVLDRAAVMMAFEQIGGAQAALEMARDYALQRYAFGRPIASFQAIKHKLADVYMAIELARSNAWYGAWALEKNAPELPIAAAAARIAASDAAWIATRENIQTHGGMGYTWDLDCHLYYRRAKVQALALGGVREWKRVLMDKLRPRTTASGTA